MLSLIAELCRLEECLKNAENLHQLSKECQRPQATEGNSEEEDGNLEEHSDLEDDEPEEDDPPASPSLDKPAVGMLEYEMAEYFY